MRYELIAVIGIELLMYSTFKKSEANKKYNEWSQLYGNENVSLEIN